MDTKKINTIFLWDLHEVVFQKNLFNWFKHGLQFKQKRALISNFNRKTAKLLTSHMLEKIGISKEPTSAQELIDLAQKENNQALCDFIMKLCCEYTPIPETVSIIKKLQELGYRHHIGSNIAQAVYQTFKNQYTDIFSLFDEFTVVQSAKNNNMVIKKPNTKFFIQHLEKHNLQPKQIIFIDDRKKNVLAAQSLGITGIQFTDPYQLKHELMDRGFML